MNDRSDSKESRKLKALALIRSVTAERQASAEPAASAPGSDISASRKARASAIGRIGLAGSVSSGKIRDHLRNQDFDSDLIGDVMRSLERDGYLNDLRCGRRILLRHRGLKAKSRTMMALLLQQQGISADAAAEILPELPDDSVSLRLLLEHEDYSTVAQKARVLRKMMGRGFERGMILRCMDEVTNDER